MSPAKAKPSAKPKDKKSEKSSSSKTERAEKPDKSNKASKWYPAHTESTAKKSRKSIRPSRYREALAPGTVLILLAGRFRGKRVILLKQLKEGALLITGPFKINGVPIRRVNSRYVIATSTKVDLKGLDTKAMEKVSGDSYFSREKKSQKQKGEEKFMNQGKESEKKEIPSERASDQKSIDKPILSAIKKEEMLASYLSSSFSLRHGQRPHEMKF